MEGGGRREGGEGVDGGGRGLMERGGGERRDGRGKEGRGGMEGGEWGGCKNLI